MASHKGSLITVSLANRLTAITLAYVYSKLISGTCIGWITIFSTYPVTAWFTTVVASQRSGSNGTKGGVLFLSLFSLLYSAMLENLPNLLKYGSLSSVENDEAMKQCRDTGNNMISGSLHLVVHLVHLADKFRGCWLGNQTTINNKAKNPKSNPVINY